MVNRPGTLSSRRDPCVTLTRRSSLASFPAHVLSVPDRIRRRADRTAAATLHYNNLASNARRSLFSDGRP
jgi:hypothetical protein